MIDVTNLVQTGLQIGGLVLIGVLLFVGFKSTSSKGGKGGGNGNAGSSSNSSGSTGSN